MTPVARARIAAALVIKRDIVSVGVCRYQTHPLQKRFSDRETRLFLHAEIDAIQNFLRRYDEKLLSSASLYIARVKYRQEAGPKGRGHSNSLCEGLAKPCDGCAQAIKHFKIKNVYFTRDAL